MAYIVKGRTYETIEDYFDFISGELGYPKYYHHFKQDNIYNDGVQLHLDILANNPGAPNILVVPGTGVYGLCYAGLMLKLEEAGYNAFALDLRGHGRSSGLRGDYTIEELMSDVQCAITYIAENYNDKISLLGSSQGGIVSFYLAACEPRIQSVICQNFADLTAPETVALTRYQNLFRVLKPLVIRFGEILPQTMLPINAYLDLEKINLRYFGNLNNFIEMDPLVIKSISLRALRSLASSPMPKPIEEIETPVMILTGSSDQIFPLSYQEALFEKLNNKKRLVIYPGKDHALLHENTEEVSPDIIAWLNDIYS